MAEYRKPSHRYLSGRVKIAGTEALSSDRHLYVDPSQVEPNLGYAGEKEIPVADKYYQLITIDNGTTYDRYWQEQTALESGGISIFDEGFLVGTANSVTKLNFVGVGVTATASGSISTITVSTSARVSVGTEPPAGPTQGDLWWDSDVGELFVRYEDGTSNQWVETSGGSETVTISDTAPSSPNPGDLWWNSDNGTLLIRYDDGDTEQWVDANAGILDDVINYWTLNSAGIHTLGNVGVGTTNPTAEVTSSNTAVFAAGIVTAFKYFGDGSGLTGVNVGAAGTWAVDTIGIHTTKNVGIGTTAKNGYKLYVEGDARVTGILTVGPASITLDGINNEVYVGTGITILGSSGIVTAHTYFGDGSNLTGIGGTVYTSTGLPADADVGSLWWDSDDGDLHVLYRDPDGNSEQWVQVNTGLSGAQGNQGAAGNQGNQGAAGNQGNQGATGNQGNQGATGNQGNQGAPGAQGDPGSGGLQGAQGNQGATGNQGDQGAQGNQGAPGNQGNQGAPGTGAQGDPGAQGNQGAPGAQGDPGNQGNQGATGNQGNQGSTGNQGNQGSQGFSGLTHSSKSTSYTLVAGDDQRLITTDSGVTVPSGIFSAGDAITIYNNSASSITITQGTSVTLRLVGSATTGNRTLAQRGLATVVCVASNEFVITGGGLT